MESEQVLPIGNVLSLGQRIAKRIVYSESHWIWPGAKTGKDGYSRVYIYDTSVMLHQILYEAMYGHQPSGRMYNRCGMQSCLNPSHWQVGTQKDAQQGINSKPLNWQQLIDRVAYLLDAISLKQVSRCAVCQTVLNLTERRRVDYLRQRGYSIYWASICDSCLDVAITTGHHNQEQRDQRIVAWAKRGRSLQWIASFYIGRNSEEEAIMEVVSILGRNGYQVVLDET